MRRHWVLVVILAAVIIVSSSLLQYVVLEVSDRPLWDFPSDWSLQRKLTDEGLAMYGGIAIWESVIHVAYVDFPADEPTFKGDEYSEVHYIRSLDMGETWSSPIRLSVNPSISYMYVPIVISARGPYVLVLWYEEDHSTTDAAMVISKDRGSTWTEPMIMNEHDADRLDVIGASIFDEMIAVVYRDWTSGSAWAGTYLRVSIDGGYGWSRERLLPVDYRRWPYIDVFDGATYVTVVDYEESGVPYLFWSLDEGRTWDSTEISSFEGHDCGLSLLIEDDYVHTICYGVGYSRSPLFSWNWTSPNPQVTGFMFLGNSERLYSVGGSFYSGNLSVTFQKSEDLGDTWSDEVVLIQGSYPEMRMLSVSADSDVIGIVWTRETDDVGSREVHFALFSSDDYSVIEEGALTSHTTDLWAILFYSSFLTLVGSSCALVVVVFYVRARVQEAL